MDSEGYKCALCGGSPGLRTERCYITDDTKEKLFAHAKELKEFGVTLEEYESLAKHVGALEGFGIALAVAESFHPGTLRDLVRFLHDKAISENEILRLRLDEPEQILTYYRADRAESK